MADGIMVCDAGNTSLKIGFANSQKILASFTLPGKEETADSLGIQLLDLFNFTKIKPESVRAAIVSSVVPAINRPLADALKKYVGCDAFFVPRDLPVPLKNNYSRPSEVGADRLVVSWAARLMFPECKSLIVVDFGTAVTFDCLRDREYLGGLIFPGPKTSLDALERNTAKLPAVELAIDGDAPLIGRDTVTSIRHGLVFGFASMTRGLCAQLAEMLEGPLKIAACGGFAPVIAPYAKIFDVILPDLALEGLRRLYYENP